MVILDEVSAACNNPLVDEVLALRGELTKTSTKKYGAMLRWTGDDRRARGTFKFHGASTGRWTGKGIQLQNLKRNLMPDTDLDIARQLVREGDYEMFELLYPLGCIDSIGIITPLSDLSVFRKATKQHQFTVLDCLKITK